MRNMNSTFNGHDSEKTLLPKRYQVWSLAWRATKVMTLAVALALLMAMVYPAHFTAQADGKLNEEVRVMDINYKALEKKLLVLQNAMSSIEHRDDQLYRMVLGVAPMDDALRNGGVGGALRYSEIRNISSGNADRILELNVKVDQLRRKLYMESVSQDEVLQWAESKKELFAATPAIQPISNGPLVTRTSGFGMRMDPFYRVIALHTGIDFAAPEGTPVYATADGEIIAADALAYGYGKMITIDHGHGYLTRYAHLLECKARVGMHVNRGERIALVGNTGLSTAAHLHYEVIFQGTIVDPINYFFADITPRVYDNITRVSSTKDAMIGN